MPVDQERADALGAVVARAGEHDVDVAEPGVADEALGAVEHPGVAVALRARLERAGVRADVGLGEREGAERLARQQPGEDALLLLLAAGQQDRQRHELHVGGHQRDRARDLRELLDVGAPRHVGLAAPAVLAREAEPEQVVLGHHRVEVARVLAVLVDLAHARLDLLAHDRRGSPRAARAAHRSVATWAFLSFGACRASSAGEARAGARGADRQAERAGERLGARGQRRARGARRRSARARSSQLVEQRRSDASGARAGRRARRRARCTARRPGSARASSRALEIGAIASCSPCMTSVGAWMQPQPRERVVVDGRPPVRPDALRRRAVAAEVAQQLAHALGLLAPERRRRTATRPATSARRRASRRRRRRPARRARAASAAPRAGRPGVVPPSTSPRTRSGKRIASSWAIIPPIESPHTCALSTSERAQQPGGVGGQLGHRRRPQRRARAARAAVVVGDALEALRRRASSTGSKTAELIVKPVISSSGSPAPRALVVQRDAVDADARHAYSST